MISLCIALHLYHDAIDSWETRGVGPRVSVAWTECALVPRETRERALESCRRLGPMRCELFDNGPDEVILEMKVAPNRR